MAPKKDNSCPDEDEACFVVDKDYNAPCGPTDEMADSSPFEMQIEQALIDRFGKTGSPQENMGDEMPDKPLIKVSS